MEDVPAMTEAEIPRFLTTGKLLLRLGSKDDHGDPVIHPVWYLFENGKLYIFTGAGSKKAKNVARSSRVYFSIDSDSEPYRGVKGKANATIMKDSRRAVKVGSEIVMKYMGADNPFEKNLSKEVNSGESVVIEISPEYFSSWDYGKTNS